MGHLNGVFCATLGKIPITAGMYNCLHGSGIDGSEALVDKSSSSISMILLLSPFPLFHSDLTATVPMARVSLISESAQTSCAGL
jgi:hypothetical protein